MNQAAVICTCAASISHAFHLSGNFGVLKSIIAAFDLDHSPARHVFEIKPDQSVKRELISDGVKKQTGCL